MPIIVDNYPRGGIVTSIEGGGVTSDLITSNNLATNTGTVIDLSNGSMKMGGHTKPGFEVTNQGFVNAVNFSERLVTVTQANSASYFRDEGSTRVGLVFDGTGTNHPNSTPGLVTMNMELTVVPYNYTAGNTKPISKIYLPNTGSGVATEVSLVIATNGVRYDDGEIDSGHDAWIQRT